MTRSVFFPDFLLTAPACPATLRVLKLYGALTRTLKQVCFFLIPKIEFAVSVRVSARPWESVEALGTLTAFFIGGIS